MVGGIQFGPDDVARLEVDEPVGTGADRLEVRGSFAGLRALVGGEEVLGEDRTAPAEGVEPERHRVLVDHLDGVVVQTLDPIDVPVGLDPHAGGGGIGRVLPIEDDVVGREGLAIVPDDVLLEPPDHPGAIPAEVAVVDGGDAGGQDRDKIAIGIVRRERLVENARGVGVLLAGAEVGVQKGRRLPPEDAQRAATATPGWRERRPRLRAGDPGGGEHARRHRGREPERGHRADKRATREMSCLDLADRVMERMFVHGLVPSSVIRRFIRSPRRGP